MMPKNNIEIVKDAISTTDIVTSGKLSSEQAKVFIDYMLKETEIFDMIQFKRMKQLHGIAYDIGVARRMLRKGVEGTAPTNYSSITTGHNEIDLIETVLATDITDQFKVENVEGNKAADHIMRLIAQQYSNDLQDLAINGNEDVQNTNASAADYLNITDEELEFINVYNGWLKLIKENPGKHMVEETFNPDNGYKGLLKTALKAMPEKWKKGGDLIYFVPFEVIEDYVYELTGRVSTMGDNALLNNKNPITFMGRQLKGVSSMPSNTALLTSPSNLAFGIFTENIKTEYARNARKRQDEYTTTSSTGVQVANYDAAVLMTWEESSGT